MINNNHFENFDAASNEVEAFAGIINGVVMSFFLV